MSIERAADEAQGINAAIEYLRANPERGKLLIILESAAHIPEAAEVIRSYLSHSGVFFDLEAWSDDNLMVWYKRAHGGGRGADMSTWGPVMRELGRDSHFE